MLASPTALARLERIENMVIKEDVMNGQNQLPKDGDVVKACGRWMVFRAAKDGAPNHWDFANAAEQKRFLQQNAREAQAEGRMS